MKRDTILTYAHPDTIRRLESYKNFKIFTGNDLYSLMSISEKKFMSRNITRIRKENANIKRSKRQRLKKRV